MFFKVRCTQEHKWWTIMDVDRLVVSDPIRFEEQEPPLCNLNLIDERLSVDSYYVANVIKDQADGITQKEYTIAFNTQAYLCNDEGKTTECFILSREEKERVFLRVELPVDMEPSAPEVSEIIDEFLKDRSLESMVSLQINISKLREKIVTYYNYKLHSQPLSELLASFEVLIDRKRCLFHVDKNDIASTLDVIDAIHGDANKRVEEWNNEIDKVRKEMLAQKDSSSMAVLVSLYEQLLQQRSSYLKALRSE